MGLSLIGDLLGVIMIGMLGVKFVDDSVVYSSFFLLFLPCCSGVNLSQLTLERMTCSTSMGCSLLKVIGFTLYN